MKRRDSLGTLAAPSTAGPANSGDADHLAVGGLQCEPVSGRGIPDQQGRYREISRTRADLRLCAGASKPAVDRVEGISLGPGTGKSCSRVRGAPRSSRDGHGDRRTARRVTSAASSSTQACSAGCLDRSRWSSVSSLATTRFSMCCAPSGWRSRAAGFPYVVVHDRTLAEFASEKTPQRERARAPLRHGPVRIARYGEPLVAVVRHQRERGS
jgi:hypothetical protein